MKRTGRRIAALLLCALLCPLMSAAAQGEQTEIMLADEGVTVNGAPAPASPGEAVYVANDIVYYPEGQDFTFGEGGKADEHAAAEADAHLVVHISKPGVYRLSGELSAGQVAVDLGEDAKKDENAVVTLILDGVSITSTVAPAIIFYDVYECGSDDANAATKDVDTSAAGANVVIADGSVNTLNGSYVARIYKPGSVELSEDGTEVLSSKKLHKYDGTLYSKRSMNVSGGEKGDGVLNINAENEGLCSDLHLTIDGGVINIVSGNDGINASEDYVSVCAITGGEVNVTVSGATGEGDGIDSNGWLLLGGGRVNASACAFSADAGIDSDMGIHITGGEVIAGGNMLDHIEQSTLDYAVFGFSSRLKGGTKLTLRDEQGSVVGEYAPVNDYSYLIIASEELAGGAYTLWQGDTQLSGYESRMGGIRPAGMNEEMPEGFDRGEMTPPEGFDRGEMPPPEGFDRGGMTPPEGFDPGRMTPPEGRELPEGFDSARQGGGFGGGFRNFGGGRDANQGEASTVFEIRTGGSVFSGVGAAEK